MAADPNNDRLEDGLATDAVNEPAPPVKLPPTKVEAGPSSKKSGKSKAATSTGKTDQVAEVDEDEEEEEDDDDEVLQQTYERAKDLVDSNSQEVIDADDSPSCNTPAPLFSFSFMQHTSTSSGASGSAWRIILEALLCLAGPLGAKGAWVDNPFSPSSGGRLFRAERSRAYTGVQRFVQFDEAALAKHKSVAHVNKRLHCPRWAVTTTIFEPSTTIRQVDSLDDWCLVVVGDKKTPSTYNISGDFLSAAQQEQLSYETLRLLRWNHFGRKNLGYLHAIANGAEWVYDFDDDNELKTVGPDAIPVPPPKAVVEEPNTTNALYNLYAQLSNVSSAWPRGFPLDHILDSATRSSAFVQRGWPAERIGVVQSFADHDPDVDGIFRLTKPMPFIFPVPFGVRGSRLFAMPFGTMMPFNAQATLFARSAFWSLLLPCTVHGRVTDIWRAYFSQRLLWDVGERISFADPWVTQRRNAHNYLADFNSEQPLYQQSGALVRALLEWKPAAATLPGRLEELYIFMYEMGVVEQEDVALAQAWIADLLLVGYNFPRLRGHEPRHSAKTLTTTTATSSQEPPPRGRTAVCMTGQPRSLFASFPDGVEHFGGAPVPAGIRMNDANSFVREFWTNTAWAGTVRADDPHPSWLVAHSIQNHVLQPLSDSGGYDLFVIEPGTSVSAPWDMLKPTTSNGQGEPDRMFVTPGGPEPDLWFNFSDAERWGKTHQGHHSCGFYHSTRLGALTARPQIQSLLYQLKHLQDCNKAVRKHAVATGTRYRYKMRLRPDFFWAAPIPLPTNLERAGELTSSQILVASTRVAGGTGQGVNDSFALGLAEPMDVYFDRLQHIHTFPVRAYPPFQCMWNAESFTSNYLRVEHGINLKSHVEFRYWLARAKGSCQWCTREKEGGASDADKRPRHHHLRQSR